ncbi:MAG: hypothetical protein M1819_003043 [Sarea resinae]|nr:MAG: hypothetical protein M1819_003043 [Sarea resinae]
MDAQSQNGSGTKPQIQPCRYKTGKTLGAGSYSVVKECVHIDTGRYYAAKVINKRLMMGREHMVRNEIAVLKRVSMGHQNILTLVDYFETMNNLYLVTDLALGGELFDRICRKGSYYESDAAELIRATLSAVAYLHDHGIVHRDLKPENLLFRTPEDNADLLIADFGLSRIMDEEQFHVLTTTCGTPGYMAPEIFKKTGHGKPVDVWAIGVITYFLLCGYTPFDRDSNLEEMQAILVADFSFTPLEYWRGVSLQARQFIKRCLTIDPTQRMTAHEALSHPFISEERPGQDDLLPVVKKNFNARRTLHAAIDTIRAINQLRAGGAAMMDGAMSSDPQHNNANSNSNSNFNSDSNSNNGNNNNTDAMNIDSPPATAASNSTPTPSNPLPAHASSNVNTNPASFGLGDRVVSSGAAALHSSRSNANGQTDAQIQEQERKIQSTAQGLWHAPAQRS